MSSYCLLKVVIAAPDSPFALFFFLMEGKTQLENLLVFYLYTYLFLFDVRFCHGYLLPLRSVYIDLLIC